MPDVLLAISGATTRTISSRTLSPPGEVHIDENSMKAVVDSQDPPQKGFLFRPELIQRRFYGKSYFRDIDVA
jgi:hypothetical protein